MGSRLQKFTFLRILRIIGIDIQYTSAFNGIDDFGADCLGKCRAALAAA